MTKFQLVDLEGKVLDESEVIIGENDTLLLEFDNSKLNLEQVHSVYTSVKKSINENKELIAYPSGVTLKVLKRGE